MKTLPPYRLASVAWTFPDTTRAVFVREGQKFYKGRTAYYCGNIVADIRAAKEFDYGFVVNGYSPYRIETNARFPRGWNVERNSELHKH